MIFSLSSETYNIFVKELLTKSFVSRVNWSKITLWTKKTNPCYMRLACCQLLIPNIILNCFSLCMFLKFWVVSVALIQLGWRWFITEHQHVDWKILSSSCGVRETRRGINIKMSRSKNIHQPQLAGSWTRPQCYIASVDWSHELASDKLVFFHGIEVKAATIAISISWSNTWHACNDWMSWKHGDTTA